MGINKIIDYTFEEYRRNLWLVVLFSAMFIVSFAALALAPGPTYVSLGGSFLRAGSIPELTVFDIATIIGAYAISLFVFADAITNINLLIKANRTQSRIPKEVVGGLTKYALKVFFVYTMAMLVVSAIHIATYDNPLLHNVIYPLVSFIVFAAIFFVPPAVVIDEMDTFHAIEMSCAEFVKKWRLVVFWAIVGLVSISVVEFVVYAFIPVWLGKYVIMAVNCLAIIPVLTIFQTQAYMEKYPLSP